MCNKAEKDLKANMLKEVARVMTPKQLETLLPELEAFLGLNDTEGFTLEAVCEESYKTLLECCDNYGVGIADNAGETSLGVIFQEGLTIFEKYDCFTAANNIIFQGCETIEELK